MKAGDGKLWRISFTVPEGVAGAFADALIPFGDSISCFETAGKGRRRLTAIGAGEPDASALDLMLAKTGADQGIEPPRARIEKLPADGWLAENRRRFAAVTAGRFFVHGAGHEGIKPPGALALELEAGPAFGSGTHETTRGCLIAIDRLAKRRRFLNSLDLGCGSGILALAIARAMKRPVLAVDIDDWAVRTAAANARSNGLGALVRVAQGDGFSGPEIRRRAPFDLIVANILARPLVRLAPDLVRALRIGGVAILSGLLHSDQAALVAAYRAQGARLIGRHRLGDWSTLTIGR
ncbi:MAG: 50S ribosomal protein L11 methyltransferase [Proteobacteria bacterium]|nr:50S ribosomal protein L11 methyltransferase [Pseudomonadota bacterium]